MSEKVIKLLNDARARELTAILQYMSQHYELEDADYGKLAKVLKRIGIVEMKHAEDLAERILYLGGVPSSKPDGVPKKGETIPKLLQTDKALEKTAIEMYNAAALVCAAEKDQISKDLFEKLLKDEEDHWNEFDVIADHVQKLGDSYLATLAGGAAE